MEAKDLVGKLAIRTFRTNSRDWSYTSSPINILKVTKNHIMFNHIGTREEGIFGDEVRILNHEYLDKCWADYKKLVKDAEPTIISRVKRRIEKKIKKEPK